MNANHSERGQALVLIVLGFVVLLGFTALAIDGSMLYSDRRWAQNAADASSLAGGGQAALSMENSRVTEGLSNFCGRSEMSTAASVARSFAIARAADNDFTIDADPNNDGISDDGSVTVQCVSNTSGPYAEKYLDVTVTIIVDTQTAFAHFVYQGPMRNRVKAVTRVNPRQPIAEGAAIVALNPAACSGQSNGTGFHGTSDVEIYGAGVHSNGCLRGDGSQTVTAEGAIQYVAEYNNNGTFTPSPTQVGEYLDEYGIEMPNCGDANAHNWTVSVFEGQTNLASGLHCVSADHKSKISLNGGSITGNNVTIVLLGVELTINGNVEVNLTAPTDSSYDPAVENLLIYAYRSSCSGTLPDINLNGNGNSIYEGTIYAPCYDLSVEGTADMTAFRSQIIGWNVEFGGTSGGEVHYEPEENYSKPTWINLNE